ncbi:MAG: ATP-binding domain-containing protein [Rhizomicrobium sp.]|jgi:hypothetical protein
MATRKSDDKQTKLSIDEANRDHISSIAATTVKVLREVAEAARAGLSNDHFIRPADYTANTFTADALTRRLRNEAHEHLQELEKLAVEPAIARIVVKSDKGIEVYFVARAGAGSAVSGGAKLVNYRAPIGRLASLPVGSEYEIGTSERARSLRILEHAELKPYRDAGEWDSRNSRLEGIDYGPITIASLQKLLTESSRANIVEDDLLERLLAEGRADNNVIMGLQRSVITKMALRDRPLLDQYQDEIFRLRLDARLAILGPPGSGKTTTLIKRLGLKLDVEFLSDEERVLAGRTIAGRDGHKHSWIMFTPTELLKQYVKEAFVREDVPASDDRIHTWSEYRRELARNKLRVLRTAAGSGSMVLKDDLESVLPSTLSRQPKWFEDFFGWQAEHYLVDSELYARRLSEDAESETNALGRSLLRIIGNSSSSSIVEPLIDMAQLSDEARSIVARVKVEAEFLMRNALSAQLRSQPNLLDSLLNFVEKLEDDRRDEEDIEEDSDEEEEGTVIARVGREAAFDAYIRASRAQARAALANRSLRRGSRDARVVEWLGQRAMPGPRLLSLGKLLQIQGSAQRFVNPVNRYIRGFPARYRQFRRDRTGNKRWYQSGKIGPSDISPLELDLVLLGILRGASGFLGADRIARDLDKPEYVSLRSVRDLFRSQVLVDEATDFSPLQLACMSALCDSATRSFLACGDFNQRITEWGSRSNDELRWVLPDIDIRSINVTYRHSIPLNELAHKIALISDARAQPAALPANVNNEGQLPVFGKLLSKHGDIATWLAQRIGEIERFTQSMPTIAVLVTNEAEVQPIAIALNSALSAQNLRAVACPLGQSVGQENDVRVFDVEHIKGLEFEAVFFVGVDQLAELRPNLFEKFLYVGATRAASYFGLTTAGPKFPKKIAMLEKNFVLSWKN